MTTFTQIADDLIHDAEARRKIISYEFNEYGDDGEYGFVKEIAARYDVHGEEVYSALREVRSNFRRNF